MIFHYTKVYLSKCNGSWVVSAKQTMNFNTQLAIMFVFFVFDKNGLIKSCSSFEDISEKKILFPRWLVQVLHPSQKFERPPFWNGWRYGIKKFGVEVTFNGMTSLLNFIKIYQLVQTLLGGGGTDRQTGRQIDGQIGDLISLTFLCKESRLKIIIFLLMNKPEEGTAPD
jgi:hypothetical protein